MDVMLLAGLRKGSMSGYDAINFMRNKFEVLVSSGTIYSHLYALERDGLIKGNIDVKKRVYCLTEKGKQTLEAVGQINVDLLEELKKILSS